MDSSTSAPAPASTKIRGCLRRWPERFGLDLRALALFRVLLGVILLVDLAARVGDIGVFYTDSGVLSRADLLDRVATGATPWSVSLHMISGLPGVQLALFAAAAFCAFCLLIGHRTRLFTVLSWLLLLSLHNRNPVILNAGDVLFRMLLFWSMFLPLGARGSVDAAMREPREGEPEGSHRTWSVAAFCFMAQVCIVYWATALLKSDPIWTEDRTAVWHALKLDYMALPLATLMREWPPGLLELVTRGTLLLEFWAPFLIWIPVFVGPLRFTACAVMLALHAGFAVTLQLGLFSYVCGAMWLALVPPAAWDRLFARFRRDPRRLGMTLYYDGDCGFCRRMVLVIRAFFLLPETAVARAQDDPAIDRAMRRRDSWVVIDHEGKQHFKFEALAYVLSRSPWGGPLGAVLGAAVFRRPGTWLYEQTASHRELMGRLTGWMRPRPARPMARPLVWAGNAVLLGTLAYVVLWNARGFHTKGIFDEDSTAGGLSAAAAGWMTGSRPGQAPGPDLRWYGRVLRVSQQWSMFAPYPSRNSGWYVVVGTLNDGTQVDLYRHVVLGEKLAQVSWERPDPIVRTFHGQRWRKYMMSLRKRAKKDSRPLFCKYLARQWKREFPLRPLEMVELYFNEERIEAYKPNTAPKKRRLWYYTP